MPPPNPAYHTKEGFETLVATYSTQLFHFLRRLCSCSDEQAEDLLQETFITAWKYIHSYDATFSIKAWLYRIARQRAISSFRRFHPSKVLGLEDAEDMLEVAADLDIPADADRQLLAEQVRACLGELSVDMRTVLLLRYSEELSYDEIADVLRKPPGTVATLIHRAKSALVATIRRTYPHLEHD